MLLNVLHTTRPAQIESSRCWQYLHTQGGTRRCVVQPDYHTGAHEYSATLVPIGPVPSTTQIEQPATVEISMVAPANVDRWSGGDKFPMSRQKWVAQIDRALKPAKRAKGYKRPVFDPDADAQFPPTWSYTFTGTSAD